jgi:fumarylacetoacetase
MKGFCEKGGLRIGFGEVTGKVRPAVAFHFSEHAAEEACA